MLTSPEPTALAGWLSPTSGLLTLEQHGELVFLGPDGASWGRVGGAVADHVRACLRGEASPPPRLFAALAKSVPGLAEALAEPGFAITSSRALERGGWGLLFVELTARCNERCLHCYVEAGPERSEALAWETIRAVLHDAADLGFQIVQLTGGEALLSPHLVEAAALARQLGIPATEVYTNGVLLDEARYSRLRAEGVSFAFSLYAADPARHDEITRLRGSHARTLKAIRLALAGGSEVRVGVIAVTPADEAHALAAAALARELGVPVGLDVSRSVGRGEHAGRPVPVEPTLASSEGDAVPRGTGHGGLPHGLPPGDGRRDGKAAVLADGSVAPCIFSRDLTLGHVGPEGGLRAALERPRLRLLRDASALPERLAAGAGTLACLECRLTAALLEPARLPQAKVS